VHLALLELALSHFEGIFWGGTVSLVVSILNNSGISSEIFAETFGTILFVGPAALGTWHRSELFQFLKKLNVSSDRVDEPDVHEVWALWLLLDLVDVCHWAYDLGF